MTSFARNVDDSTTTQGAKVRIIQLCLPVAVRNCTSRNNSGATIICTLALAYEIVVLDAQVVLPPFHITSKISTFTIPNEYRRSIMEYMFSTLFLFCIVDVDIFKYKCTKILT